MLSYFFKNDFCKITEYIRELTKLQDEVGTFDNNLAMSILGDELGMDPFEVYDFDPPTPIASASIGQVIILNDISVVVL